ncbi:polysaccharide deacetylase family protein [Paenibacillus xanthanilyticus]|uniref:Polysaccharide deacetylase family protein n=1 Tax=Paenibacillus xanthanilyticus TaxID=1783531 RepID=A0ABV8KBU6_9BACL
MKLGKTVAMAIMMGTLLIAVQWSGDWTAYINGVKQGVGAREAFANLTLTPEHRTLRKTIEEEAAKTRMKPVNAKVDRIWKAIPGYNGLEIDVEQTVERMKHAPLHTPIDYVYKETPPAVGLDDLGAVPIYRGNPNKKMASFMINVAWGNEYVEPMLKTLRKENVKATFFLDGSWLKNNPELAKKIQSEGHEISNHAYSHPSMSKLSRQAQLSQITRTEALLKSTLGVQNRWFAPPSGDYNQLTVDVAYSQGLKTVLWTLDTVDWQHPSPSSIVAKIGNRIEPGSLILMHPTDSASGALPGMIKAIKAKGYALGTVSDTLSSARVPQVVTAP